ncbi:ATP-dependent Clp protease proteolytic subunit, partial [Morganella morganii]|uniref:ATP-dependent Clp protease proteolytic subunit n=1 Tax=Morganella morganii TaxID=582 RepID=UPI0015F418F8
FLKVKTRINVLLAHPTGKSVEKIHRDTERDRFLSAKEAQEYDLVDHIYTLR